MTIPTLIYCADGNRRLAQIALDHGFRYGAQLPNTVYYPPYFADQAWRKPDRNRYMAALAVHRPALATVLDWERDDQRDEVLSWAEEAARYVTEAVIVIPKVMSSIPDLPRQIGGREVRLGYSVPTRFAGTQVPVWEFAGWPVHLLGGSPRAQMTLARYLDVKSADGNYTQQAAVTRSAYFVNGTARRARNRYAPQLCEVGLGDADDAPYLAFALSCINTRNAWTGLSAAVRYASEADLLSVRRIIQQYRAEIGPVTWPALRRGLAARELFVATYDTNIVGFVHWHRRRDGWSTVYEIAAHRDARGQGVGRALMNAIPRPVRLKVTQDNARAIGFYEQYGMTRVRAEQGRVRPLFVYELERSIA